MLLSEHFFLCMTATLTPSAASIIVSQNEQNEAVGEIGTGKIKLIDEYWSKGVPLDFLCLIPKEILSNRVFPMAL